ncbi:glucodextranase-like protein [Hypnocyclicus thermotrophus]|uniref:Glucodextranase-like protein n=1 Tax=Hypnocyclicus thermotrophus TaxID=1627895 RepID=A0AA46DYB1_9FUSO|nr:glucodextranase DOMON-like domain-containing protein [Hypnocyclicus thermotrophus]TDT69185.1 glucodextranase-like protein [Hypnocyclicus thermotrophus]
MKKVSKILLALSILSLSACSVIETKTNNTQGQSLFFYKDKVNDDNGYGNYKYPTDKKYTLKSLDINSIEITENKKEYNFIITVGSFINNYSNNDFGWEAQMFDIYLNFNENKYYNTIYGRNLKIKDKWDKVIVVAPLRNVDFKTKFIKENTDVKDDTTGYENITEGLIYPDNVDVQGNKFIVSVSKDKISFNKLKGIQVFSMGFDTSSNGTFNTKVDEFVGLNSFGGGTDYNGDSNVIDILGDNSLMKNYVSEEGKEEFAEIELIKVK